jgi:hypothetical protein
MGYWDDIKTLGNQISNNPLVNQASFGLFHSTIRTGKGVFGQIGVTADVIESAVSHLQTRQLSARIGQIVVNDIWPIIKAAYLFHVAQEIMNGMITEDPIANFFSVYTALKFAQFLVVMGLSLWSWTVWSPQAAQVNVRTTVVSLDAPQALLTVECGLFKMRSSPMEKTYEDLVELEPSLNDRSAVILFKQRLFFANHADREVKLLEPTTGNVERFNKLAIKLSKKIRYPYKLANSAERELIEILTGRSLTLSESPMPTICKQKNCSIPKVVFGNLGGIIIFKILDLGLFFTSYLFPKTGYITNLLSMSLYGGFILESVLSGMCREHQLAYYREYAGLEFSFGLVHWGLTQGVVYLTQSLTGLFSGLIEKVTGIPIHDLPPEVYETYIKQLLLLLSIAIAAHMHLPPAVDKSTRTRGPLALMRAAMTRIYNWIVLGIRKEEREPGGDPISQWIMTKGVPVVKGTLSALNVVWNHPRAQNLKHYLLPTMLHSAENFINDPVIASHLEWWRHTIIYDIKILEKVHKNVLIKFMEKNPTEAAFVIKKWLRVPAALTETVLLLMADPKFMHYMYSIRRILLAKWPGEDVITIETSTPARSLRDDDIIPMNPAPTSNPTDDITLSPEMAILAQGVLSLPMAPTPVNNNTPSSAEPSSPSSLPKRARTLNRSIFFSDSHLDGGNTSSPEDFIHTTASEPLLPKSKPEPSTIAVGDNDQSFFNNPTSTPKAGPRQRRPLAVEDAIRP